MTTLLGRWGNGIVALLTLLTLVVLASWLGARATPVARNHPFDDYPALFVEGGTCPSRGDVLENGRRSEEFARLRTDRYAYDPRDGVRAVRRYQEAESCYRAAGDEFGAQRVRRAGAALTARVNTDYAAARLNLLNALERERWSVALSEIRRLLLLTDHIGRHEYVEWLSKIIGRVAVKASTPS
jgi:hypothetical protein